jgi:uncharacterized OB-fold protein
VAEPVGHPLLPHAVPFGEPRDLLRLQRCRACGASPEFPRIACPRCLGELEWVEASGRGRVFTFGVVRRPHHARFELDLPIVLAVIELDEGPLVISNVVGDDRLETEIGSSVEFIPEGGFASLPQFRLAT